MCSTQVLTFMNYGEKWLTGGNSEHKWILKEKSGGVSSVRPRHWMQAGVLIQVKDQGPRL